MEYRDDIHPGDDARTAVNKIINARRSDDVVILIGDCTVNYDSGDTWAYTEGRHSVNINPSGSVVVHHPDSVKAKNWQPKGANTNVHLDEDDEVVIESVMSNSEDSLVIRFTNLVRSVHYEPSDYDVDLRGSEKEVHRYIFNNPSVIDEKFRPEKMEKEVSTGDIDIFGSIDGTPVVVEVKRKKGQQEDVGQLSRYCDVLDDPIGILVAPDITRPAHQVLKDEHGFRFVELSPSVVLEDD